MIPNVKCPYCKKVHCVLVSGFAGELAIREKVCRFCGKIFYVHMLVTTSKDRPILDGEITNLNYQIKFLRKERQKLYTEKLIRYEQAKKIHEEALEIARAMRKKRNMN